MSTETVLGSDQRFFTVVLQQKNLDNVWCVENVSFSMNNP